MKKLIAALALGMLIGSAATAFAAPDVVQATVAKFKFIVNGEEREIQTEQLVVMGTTYLPVREVANMLGHDVTYKADSQTIELNKPEEVNSDAPDDELESEVVSKQEELPQISGDLTPVPDYNWPSLRDLSILGLNATVDNSTSSITISKDGIELVIDLQAGGTDWTTEVVMLESNLGPVQMKKVNGSTLISRADLEKYGVIPAAS